MQNATNKTGYRSRVRSRVFYRDKEYPIKGPVILVDDHLYTSQDVNRSSRTSLKTLISIEENGVVHWSELGFDTYVGPESDTLDQFGRPNAIKINAVTLFKLYMISSLDSSHYDASRECWWLTPRGGLPDHDGYIDPTREEWDIMDPGYNNDFHFRLDICSDYNDPDYLQKIGGAKDVSHSAVILALRGTKPTTFFIKASRWSRQGGVEFATCTVYYIRFDVWGIEQSILANIDLGGLFGFSVLNEANPDLLGIDLDNFFKDANLRLDQAVLAAKSKAVQSTLDTLVTLAEGHETVKLLRSAGRTLRILGPRLAGYITLLKATKGQYKRLPRHLASKWLELRYGWRQLYFDVSGLIQASMSFLRKSRRSFTSGSRQPLPFVSSLMENTIGTSTMSHYIEAGVDTPGGILLSAGCATAESDQLSTIVNRFGGINLLSLTWELIRLSFVLDWLAAFGQYARVLGTNPARYIRLWKTLRSAPGGLPLTFKTDQLSHTDLYDLMFDFRSDSEQVWWNAYVVSQALLGNDEDTIEFCLETELDLYLRVTLPADSVPFVLPQGGFGHWDQVADLISLIVSKR